MATELHDDDPRLEDLERTLDTVREEAEVAQVLLGLSAALAEVSSVEETLDKAVHVVPTLLGADQCFAATWDPLNQRFWVRSHAGFTPEEADRLVARAASDTGLPFLRDALREHAPTLVSDAQSDPSFSPEDARRRGIAGYIGIPLLRWGGEFGGLGVVFKQKRLFGAKDEALARGIARQVGAALATARQFNLLEGLRRFGEQVASKLRLTGVIDQVAAGARELVSGDASWLYFADSKSSLVAAGAGNGAPVPDELLRLDLTQEPWSRLLTQERVMIGDLGGPVPGPHHSGLLVPVFGSDSQLLAAIFVLFDRALTLSDNDHGALRVLAAQSAMAIENAQRFERQRSVARSLQEGLLSSEMPELKGCTVAAVYEPAGGEADIGGDFFDVFDLPDGRFVLVVGDVSGKGAEAAAQTAMAKYMLRAFAMRDASPSSVLYHLNNALTKGFSEDRFITLVYGLFDPATRALSVARGGHPPPLIYRADGGVVEEAEIPGALLGVFEDQNYHYETFELGPGDVFLIYTDGLPEARKGTKLYGRAAVVDSLRNRAPRYATEDLARRLYRDAEAFGTITDDTIIFVLRCDPEGAA